MGEPLYGSTWKGTYSSYSAKFQVYVAYTVDNDYMPDETTITIDDIGIVKTSGSTAVEFVSSSTKYCTATINGNTVTYDKDGTSVKFSKSNPSQQSFGSGYVWYIPKGTASKTVTMTVYGCKSGGAWNGSSSLDVTIEISERGKINLSYSKGTQTGATNMPSDTQIYFNTPYMIPLKIPTDAGFEFVNWSNGYARYNPLSYVSFTSDTTLTAEWSPSHPPTCNFTPLEDVGNDGHAYSTLMRGYSKLKTTVTDLEVYEGRNLASISITCGNTETVYSLDDPVAVTPESEGTFQVTLTVTDDTGAYSMYNLGEVIVYPPIYVRTVTYNKSENLFPNIDANGNADITIYAWNYGESSYDQIDQKVKAIDGDSTWSFNIELTEDYIKDPEHNDLETKIKVDYNHTDTSEKAYRKSFYDTSRNANFSTGVANTIFISGCDETDYSSRVWWSYVNNPLYFPDTNYVEVGSNDTAVMGLIKVGSYLGAIKQSKTTDTAIYLLYPTSFDDETTYAVKQGIQGVGAIGKFTFNILGDETLFLSPKGVMAIEIGDDADHKVKNRSFYLDGKLLDEEELSSAYSFVFEGCYYLALPNGHCYVLDGNQRNSWGNDKTNLVYEGYYLENIPAYCFMKYKDQMWFSNGTCICGIKTDKSYMPYADEYDMNSDDTDVPVFGEWSTVSDDDGSLHYLKTMQKKGNVVSIYPCGKETSAEVFVRKDANEEVSVGTVNGTVEETGDIPNELHIKKKFKKYKRLQFIIRNDKAEGFGVASITKSYFVGNYAKK